MPALTPQQQRWEAFLQALENFLNRWQQQSPQHRLDINQLTQVYRLYAVWRQQQDEPLGYGEYGLRLGPLLCSDAEQQALFQRLWHSHWAQVQENRVAHATQDTPKKSESSVEPSTHTWYEKPQQLINQRLKRLALLFLTVLFSVVTCSWPGVEQQRPPDKAPASITSPAGTKPIKSVGVPVNPEKPYLKTIPKRQPPPSLTLNELEKQQLANMRYFVLAGALGLIGLVIGLIWWLRRVVFQSHFSRAQEEDQLHLKLLPQTTDSEFMPGFSTVLAKLRFAKVGLKKIHWGKTLAATVRRGGFPQLRYRDRYRQVDFVLLTDSRHRYDQTAWLMEKLNQTLTKAQVRVHKFDFDRQPDWLWPEGDRTRKPLPLEQILLRHPNSRILLVSEHDVLFYRLTGEIQDWLKRLHQHASYQLGLLSQPDSEQQQRLQQGHYPYRLLNGIRDLTPLLDFSKPENSKVIAALPDFDSDWLGNSQPEDTHAVLVWLQETVGNDGLRLLQAMAMYPKLDGELTLALYQWFTADPKTPQPQLTPSTLLKTVALPWCRQGWLPHWLRQLLLKQMAKADYQHARQFFVRLFDSKNSQTGKALGLDIQKPPPFWQRLPWLRAMHKNASYNSPMRDQVFTRILLWPHNPLAQLPLLGRLMNALPKAALSVWGPALALIGLTGLSLVGVYGLWQWQGVPRYGSYLLHQKQAQHGNILVNIRYHPATESLKDILGAGLSGLGYRVSQTADETLTVNRVTASPPIINEITTATTYLSWDIEFGQIHKGGQVSIELATLPQTGQVFRDTMPEQPSLITRYPESVAWQPAENIEKGVPKSQIPIDISIQPIEPKMVNIPAGQFLMGSPNNERYRHANEGPQHAVKVAAFQLAKTELTFAEWDVCVKAKACPEINDQGWWRDNRPVINVSWNNAQSYINWLNQSLGLSSAQGYRLPTEAEWEYAARAGTTTPFFWDKQSLCDYANGNDNYQNCNDGFDNTAPVQSFNPNAWGLYDLSGNVWEWVADCHHDSYKGAPDDGRVWQADQGECTLRSVRGGGWTDKPWNLRSAYRYGGRPNAAYNDLGIRLARTD